MNSDHELNLSYFEKILSAQKEQVSKNLADLNAEVNGLIVGDEVGDIEDTAKLQIDNTIDQTLIQRLNTELIDIDDALTRIQTGVYGICEKTGKQIPIERLLASPTARFVVNV